MEYQELVKNIKDKKSILCLGLDTDKNKLPDCLSNSDNPVLEFNKAIIDNTKDIVVAYKINTAFYEADGLEGWKNLKATIDYIPDHCFIIADAKRADIGNTSKMYAKAFFDYFNADAITLSPYMGIDSIQPFLEFQNKWSILLALTSNPGSKDFQYNTVDKDKPLFIDILEKSKKWGDHSNMMYVVGATHPDELIKIRKVVPSHFLLIPGIGAQGGDLESVLKYGLTEDYGLLINVSRGIIYASGESDFAEAARNKAIEYNDQMKNIFGK